MSASVAGVDSFFDCLTLRHGIATLGKSFTRIACGKDWTPTHSSHCAWHDSQGSCSLRSTHRHHSFHLCCVFLCVLQLVVRCSPLAHTVPRYALPCIITVSSISFPFINFSLFSSLRLILIFFDGRVVRPPFSFYSHLFFGL